MKHFTYRTTDRSNIHFTIHIVDTAVVQGKHIPDLYDLYDLHDLSHVAGWEPYDLLDLSHVSWVGHARCRLCTKSRNRRYFEVYNLQQ